MSSVADRVFDVRDLSTAYRMGDVAVSALRHVTLDIQRGEFIVFLGPSGSGTSTLLNILGGLDARPVARSSIAVRTSRTPPRPS